MAMSETGGPGAGRVVVEQEFVDLLDSALRSARAGAMPRYVLTALRDAAAAALATEAKTATQEASPRAPARGPDVARTPQSAAAAELKDWTPAAKQIWRSGMKGPDGKRLTAWQAYQAGFGDLPRSALPYAHQVRQHPKTKELYNALCVHVSRNKARRTTPASIADLFNVTDEARGGLLSASGGGRPRLKQGDRPEVSNDRGGKRKRP